MFEEEAGILEDAERELRSAGKIFVIPAVRGIPVIHAHGDGLAEAYENSLIALGHNGSRLKTQYDKPTDPPSIDATAVIIVNNPRAEPVIHKDFPGGPEDLQEYVMEVCDGIKDDLIRDPEDPTDTRWEYTYHERLTAFDVPSQEPIDQVARTLEYLAKNPETRRANIVTWQPWKDMNIGDPACLQSIWLRISPAQDSQPELLNMNVRMRSNDAYKAAFMNMFAFTRWQERFAQQLSEMRGREVVPGRYFHEADSYHVYGSYFNEFFERFARGLGTRSFEGRTARLEDWKEFMDEAVPGIEEKVKGMSRER